MIMLYSHYQHMYIMHLGSYIVNPLIHLQIRCIYRYCLCISYILWAGVQNQNKVHIRTLYAQNSYFTPISLGVTTQFISALHKEKYFLSFGGLHHLRTRQPDKNQKNRRQKVFRFYCWQHILAHISGHGCDK